MLRVPCLMLFAALACGCGAEDLPPADAPDAGETLDAGDGTDDAGTADAGTADAGQSDGGDPCAKPGVRSIKSLALEPAEVAITKGSQARIAVTATFNDGCQQLVTGSLHFKLGDAAVARVVEAAADPDTSAPGRALEGLAKGTTTLQASTGPNGGGVVSNAIAVTVTDDTPVVTPTETRGVWVTRFAIPADKTSGPAKVKALIKSAADNHFNVVYFQVRGAGEAYYRSSLVPWWVKDSTGKLGVDPGWDPLQVALDEAKLRGIEVHAYVNALSGWAKSGGVSNIPDSVAGAPKHILRQHPEWTCLDANNADTAAEYTWIAADPGYRAHFKAVIEELLTRYPDLAGIHLDRIRTPGPAFCHSPELDRLYAAQYGTDKSKWAEFSRAQVDATVEASYQAIAAKKPKAVLSAAVWGIYKRLPGCSTSEGYSGYHQDSLGWMKKGIIDVLNPMIYWDLAPGSCTDWGALVDQFLAGASGRQIVAGMNALEAGDKLNFDRVAARIAYGRGKQLPGHVVFASAYLDQYAMWPMYKAGPYKDPIAPTPLKHR
ncbi:MAG: glycoside hydrolase family 10 protein [Myxococcales bacterium]